MNGFVTMKPLKIHGLRSQPSRDGGPWFKIDEEEEQAFKKMFVRFMGRKSFTFGLEDDNFDSDINCLRLQVICHPSKSLKILLDEDTNPIHAVTTMSMTLVTSVEPPVQIACNFRELPQWVRMTIRRVHGRCGCLLYWWCPLWEISWMVREGQRCQPIASVVTTTEKIQRFKGSFGMVRCLWRA